jgi:hypothetical protein
VRTVLLATLVLGCSSSVRGGGDDETAAATGGSTSASTTAGDPSGGGGASEGGAPPRVCSENDFLGGVVIERMSGTFDNAAQRLEDPTAVPRTLRGCRVNMPELSDNVLFVESWSDAADAASTLLIVAVDCSEGPLPYYASGRGYVLVNPAGAGDPCAGPPPSIDEVREVEQCGIGFTWNDVTGGIFGGICAWTGEVGAASPVSIELDVGFESLRWSERECSGDGSCTDVESSELLPTTE